MSLYIRNNSTANTIAATLTKNYTQLARSTERLASGLRVNSAADDAAGLAIRELMRGDIAALRQGMRNTNDAISMLQTADGALSIIDEKLIRMKELAEQAATGTYDSTQRAMIDSEFQQMASEIDRIAKATDFNGIKLLDGPYASSSGTIEGTSGTGTTHKYEATVDTLNVVRTNAGGQSLSASGIIADITQPAYLVGTTTITVTNNNTTEITTSSGTKANVTVSTSGAAASSLPSTLNVTWNASESKWETTDYPERNTLTSTQRRTTTYYESDASAIEVHFSNGSSEVGTAYIDLEIQPSGLVPQDGESVTLNLVQNSDSPTYRYSVVYRDNNGNEQNLKTNENISSSDITIDDTNISFNLDIDGTNRMTYDFTMSSAISAYSLSKFTSTLRVTDTTSGGGSGGSGSSSIPESVVKIHFGSGNDSSEDYYYINKRNATTTGLGIGALSIKTQEYAQQALRAIDDAIVKKDQMRAYYGTMQNRLENTMTTLSVQSDNLQAAESRISDVDVAVEMMNFVRNQILTQSAVAMLAQANSMPQMAMRLIGG